MTSRWTLAPVASTIALALLAALPAGAAPPKPHRPPKISHRPDVSRLPDGLKDRLNELNARPHSFPPLTIFAEAALPSMLFQYYLLDTTGFQPNVFTITIPGINDGVAPTATGANHDRPTIGAVRLALEPK